MSLRFTSRFGMDLENMIRLKISLGGAESTYLDRARNFDQFCLANYPDADCLTEPLALSWIKDAGAATGVIISRIAFERGFAAYLNAVGKTAYVLPERFASGRSIFVPYIFTDNELAMLFQEIDAYQYPMEPFRPVLLSAYFRLTYADAEHKRQAIARALGDTAAPGVAPANYTVTDEELLKCLYGL